MSDTRLPAPMPRQLPGFAVTEHGFEPVRGLPERLPPGEAVLWQGAPDWRSLARHALKLPWIAAYFVALAVWRGWAMLAEQSSLGEAAIGALWMILLGLVPVVLMAIYAVLVARTSVYTLTTRRLVLRVGVALPFTINLPYGAVHSAGLKLHGDGTGDIVLGLAKPHRVAWLMLWPHLRPWRMRDPQPMLRGLADAEQAAQILARSLAATAGQAVPATDSPAAEAPLAGRPAAAAAA